MDNEKNLPAGGEYPDRWTLIRDVAVFQVKLVVDGFRDVILVPVSIGAGILSLVRGGSRSGSEFYDLLRLGRRSESWINLFGAADHGPGAQSGDDLFPSEDIDSLVQRVESFVVEEYRKGGVTTQAKARLDGAIDTLNRMGRRPKKPADTSGSQEQ
jgi:hypothetical protein